MEKLKSIIEHKNFTIFITILILINAVTLGLETDEKIMSSIGHYIIWIDRVILFVFTIEILTKILVYRFSFFKNGWNIFDFIIVAISYVPTSGNLSVFRALRILRLFSMVPQLRKVVNALFTAIPGMMAVIGVLLIVFYVAAVLSTNLFGSGDNGELQIWFGSIGASMYTLFQIMTLESWSMGIVRPTIELYPWAWVFFVPFIIVTSFAVLNLFIGIIVDAMHSSTEEEGEAKIDRVDCRVKELQLEIRDLEKKIDMLIEKNK